MAFPLASAQEEKQLLDLNKEIFRLQEEIAKRNSALGGNRESMASILGKKADGSRTTADDFFGRRQELSGQFRKERQDLERQLATLVRQRAQLKQALDSRVLARERAKLSKLPLEDQNLIQNLSTPEGRERGQQEMRRIQTEILTQVEQGARPEEIFKNTGQLNTLADALDKASGTLGMEGELGIPGQDKERIGPNREAALAFISQNVAKTLSAPITQSLVAQQEALAPPEEPVISAVPTEGEERAAVALQESQRAAAPFPAPVPSVPGEGLADTLQRIAPAGPGAPVPPGTTALNSNSGQGPLTAPPGEQLVFRSGPGGQIEAGTTALGTPGSEQFTSGFRPNQELTQRIQAPPAGTVQPGQGEQRALAPPPAPVETAPPAPPPLRAPSPSVLSSPQAAQTPGATLFQGFESAVGTAPRVSTLGAGLERGAPIRALQGQPAQQPAPQGAPAQAQPDQQAQLARRTSEAQQMANNLRANGLPPEQIAEVLRRNFPDLAGL